MGIAEILASIDREIFTLQRARTLIAAGAGASRKRGRPRKAQADLTAVLNQPAKKRKKRKLTPEGRKRIAEAQKLRWDASRKAKANSK